MARVATEEKKRILTYMSDDTAWFRGDTGWAQNGYVIFPGGLGYKEEKGNPFAVQQGYDLAHTLIGTKARSNLWFSSYQKFISYMNAIIEKERNVEIEYLQAKVTKYKADPNYANSEWLSKFSAAVNAFNLPEAFTILNSTEENLEKMATDIANNKFKDIQHTAKFYKSLFRQNMLKIMKDLIINDGEKVFAKPGQTMTLAQIVDKAVKLSIDSDEIPRALNQTRDSIAQNLLASLNQSGFNLKSIDSVLFAQGKNYTKILAGSKANLTKEINRTMKNKEGNVRRKLTTRQLLEQNLPNDIVDWLGSELQAAADASRIGEISIMTGTQRRVNAAGHKVQRTADVISYDLGSVEIDLGESIQSLMNQLERDDTFIDNDKLDELIRNTLRDKFTQDTRIFEVVQNVKGYKSSNNRYGGLQIKGSGSFRNRSAALKELALTTPGLTTLGGGDGLNFFDKLVFILNNTVEGAIAANQINQVAEYIAVACMAYMFDDYAEFYSAVEPEDINPIKKLRLFNSGGAYVPASVILERTLADLQNSWATGKFGSGTLVKVNITPPDPSTIKTYYQGVRTESETNPPFTGDFVTDQSLLKERWDYVRDLVQEQGRLEVKVDQNELNKLFSQFELYLKS